MTTLNVHKWRIKRARCFKAWVILKPHHIYHWEAMTPTHAEAVKELDRLRTGRRK